MTVETLKEKLRLNPVSLPLPEREIDGAYIGDLLSWVMGRASCNNVWITIMSNVNVIAVASLVDVSCVILAEGVTLEDDVRRTAIEKSVNVLSSSLSAYDLATELYGILK